MIEKESKDARDDSHNHLNANPGIFLEIFAIICVSLFLCSYFSWKSATVARWRVIQSMTLHVQEVIFHFLGGTET